MLAGCAFTWVTKQAIDTVAARSLLDRSQLCAASLVPARDGDLSASVERLQSQYERFVAVATLTPAGDIEHVHPDRPAHRRAAMAVLDSPNHKARVQSPLNGQPIDIAAAVVPLNGSSSPSAQKALILFRRNTYHEVWTQALWLFGAALAFSAVYVRWSLCRWFDGRVASRLRYLVNVTDELPRCPAETPTVQACEWTETNAIGQRFQELVDQIASTNARAHRLKQESEQEIRQREHGFDQKLRRAQDKATVDALTKVRNRAFFEDRLEPLFEEQKENSRDLAAVMVDIDNFKPYNDLHGHQAGDLLLKFVGALLRGAVRPEDYAIRYGGDEFLLLLPETDSEQASAIAERLVRLFGQYTRSLRRKQHLSLSIGVASLIRHCPESGHELVVKADQALYAAKRQGKNSVAICPRVRLFRNEPQLPLPGPTAESRGVVPPAIPSSS